jgi:hypothetical protein
MNLIKFRESLAGDAPPASLTLHLQALWYDGKNDWQKAHILIQDEPGTGAALIHAYLHRKEGDNWNADYWYRLAKEKRPPVSLEQEWEQLVVRFLA